MTAILTYHSGEHEIGPAVVALGVFDGVHVGHQALVTDTISHARARDCASCVLTFDRDPDQVVAPAHAAPQLTTIGYKVDLLAALQPDAILVVPFDLHLASLTPSAFCTDVLLDAARLVACVVGHDFRFGFKASGDATTLAALGATHGFDVMMHPLVHVGGEPVTSTRIRQLVARGDVAEAATLLGRAHRLEGIVERGQGIGRSLGAPTANLTVAARFALPAPGVYAGWATALGNRYPAAISVGIPPTFPDATCPLEAHLIGFDGDLYGRPVLLEFAWRLRAQRAFASSAALSSAIAEDIAHIAGLLALDSNASDQER
jgi:riboflavin kinase/FMN adenylyltransferase